MLRPRGLGAALLTAAALASTTGCLNLITNDPALLDEFAEFKANGGQCTGGGGGGVVGDIDYSEATRYRWLGYGGVLGETVSDRGRVYYDTLLADDELMDQLRRTVADMATVNPQNLPSHDDKLAFWMNAYNALVLLGAAEAYQDNPAFRVDDDGFSFFDLRVHTVGGALFSLNEIEHGVLRGTLQHASTGLLPEEEQQFLLGLHDDLWGDVAFEPRFHFAINCASSSCPELIGAQFRGATVQNTLDELTTAFLLDEGKGAGPNGISQLFDFYFDDFVAPGDSSAEPFISQFRDTDDVNVFNYLPYDWSLNNETQAAE